MLLRVDVVHLYSSYRGGIACVNEGGCSCEDSGSSLFFPLGRNYTYLVKIEVNSELVLFPSFL